MPDRDSAAGSFSLAFLLFALLAGHTMASMASLVLPAVAPAVARDYGFDPSLIGYQISLVALGMVASFTLLGNLSRRIGPCRTNQIGHALVGSGMLVMLIPWPAFLVIGSLVLGVGYGMITPSASSLLLRFSPPERRNVVFSVHQVGIPLGGILAALAAPVVTVFAGWRWSVALSAALLYGVVLLMQRRRRHWDDDRDPSSPAVAANPFAGVGTIWRPRRLRLVAIAAACLSWVQFSVVTFTVVACVEVLGMSLVLAGVVLTVVQLSSAGGRLVVGWLVDRVKDTAQVLAWTAGVLVVASACSLALSTGMPSWAPYLLFALLGGLSGCWPGTVLADVGRLAPHGQVSLAISGALLIINVGKFLGPAVLANVYALTHSYGIGFATLAVPSAIAFYCLMAARRMRTA